MNGRIVSTQCEFEKFTTFVSVVLYNNQGLVHLHLSKRFLASRTSSASTTIMSQSKTVTLNDKEVSRRMALKAMHDNIFERKLLACASPDFVNVIGKGNAENYISVSHAIITIRAEMINQAGLRVPLVNGFAQDITPYLRKMKTSRLLLGIPSVQKVDGVEVTAVERDREWGWVVSYQPCVQ